MYSLRTVYSNGVQANKILGNHYSLLRNLDIPSWVAFGNHILARLERPQVHIGGFSETEKNEINNYVRDTKIYAILIMEDGTSMDLFSDAEYYVMCSDGNTFANLTKK